MRDNWIVYWILVILGISFFNGLERIMIGICGENLTFNVRKDLVRGILYKQLSWFDREERAPGVLTGILSEDISLLNGMTTETIVVIYEAIMGLALGLLLGLIYCW
jgi:ABC-type bacteriocin/lantibiotic exporter with double-glycine peptidase domain